MTRTEYALTHPCSAPDQCTLPEYGQTTTLPGGNMLHSILAVDR